MFSMLTCFRALKMKYQIIIGETFIMALILAAILCIYFIQQTILFNFIKTSSQMISMREEKKQLNVALNLIESYLERKYHQPILNIQHIDEFFQYYLLNQNKFYNISDELFQPCVQQENKKSQKIMHNSNLFCYQSLINSDGKNEFKQIISLLSQFSMLFDVTQDTQLTVSNLPNPNLLFSYPMMFQIADFNIQTRPWYIAYLESSQQYPNESYYYSPVYQSAFTNNYVRAAISTIKYNNTNYGFNRNTIQLTDQQLTNIALNILLTNNEGQILLSSVDSIQSLLTEAVYIYEEDITGFNSTDWGQIQEYIQQSQPHQDSFCLFNKLFQSSVQLDALQFKKEQFNLILFTNVTFQGELDLKLADLTASLISEFVQIEWILIIVCFAMLIITVILIHFIFIPLSQLMDNVKMHIHKMGNNINKEIFKFINQKKQATNVFSDLHVRFLALYEMLNKNQCQKSKLCLEIEQFPYSLKPTDLDYCKISENIQQMPLFIFNSANQIEFINNTLKKKYCQNHQ